MKHFISIFVTIILTFLWLIPPTMQYFQPDATGWATLYFIIGPITVAWGWILYVGYYED